MTEQETFEDRLRLKIEAYHEAALVYAAVKLGLPDRLAAGPVTGEQLAGGAWTFGASPPPLLARALHHRHVRGASRRQRSRWRPAAIR